MVGAVQLGLLAACFVLFVPMGMAGWHLSRNKVLFFSGALFITLAVGVHLTPYFPSVAQFIASLSSPYSSYPSPPIGRTRCLPHLHDIVWGHWGPNSSATWDWAPSKKQSSASGCGFQKLGGQDASDLLNGSWVLVAGDSQARLFALALLRLVIVDDPLTMDSVERDLFKRHSDYHIVLPDHGVKVDYLWAPYETNLTEVMRGLRAEREYPDVLVMGSGLWHMLHISNATDYGSMLDVIRRSAASLVPIQPELVADEGPLMSSEAASTRGEGGRVASVQPPHMFWLGMPTLVHPLLNSEEKKEKMGYISWDAYSREFTNSMLLRGSGGHFVLLDVTSLSRRCGSTCTLDGIHYDGAVYEAAMQIMLNALLIESHQRVQ